MRDLTYTPKPFDLSCPILPGELFRVELKKNEADCDSVISLTLRLTYTEKKLQLEVPIELDLPEDSTREEFMEYIYQQIEISSSVLAPMANTDIGTRQLSVITKAVFELWT